MGRRERKRGKRRRRIVLNDKSTSGYGEIGGWLFILKVFRSMVKISF
jgi:hypothetical protein